MFALVKPEHVGETHPIHGKLYPNIFYQVEELGELFELVKETPIETPPKAEKE